MAFAIRTISASFHRAATRSNVCLTTKRWLANEVSKTTEKNLVISDSCLKRLREICQDGSFLRITVEGGGCSGFQYKFDLDKLINEDDLTFGESTAKVVIDTTSLEYCGGATVDYHTETDTFGFSHIKQSPSGAGLLMWRIICHQIRLKSNKMVCDI